MDFSIDKAKRTIRIERAFAAPLARVWAAWTESHLLDQWWAPKPYRTETKSQEFRPGGFWLYSMVAPEGARHWCRSDYQSIEPMRAFSARDTFCDENSNYEKPFPDSLWVNRFTESGDGTVVVNTIEYASLEELEKIVEMGFREGYLAAQENLVELLK